MKIQFQTEINCLVTINADLKKTFFGVKAENIKVRFGAIDITHMLTKREIDKLEADCIDYIHAPYPSSKENKNDFAPDKLPPTN